MKRGRKEKEGETKRERRRKEGKEKKRSTKIETDNEKRWKADKEREERGGLLLPQMNDRQQPSQAEN